MLTEIEKNGFKQWIDDLIDKELSYLTGRNTVTIKSTDWGNDDSFKVLRGETEETVKWDLIELVMDELKKGSPIHIDTVLGSNGNKRTIVETIVANFPNIGYMPAKTGRNQNRNKVIQCMGVEIHPLGETLDVSGKRYTTSLISGQKIRQFVFDVICFLVQNKIVSPLTINLLHDGKKDSNIYNLVLGNDTLNSMFLVSTMELSETELTTSGILRFFKKSFEIESRKYYLSTQWTKKDNGHLNINSFIKIFNELYSDYRLIVDNDSYMLVKAKNKIYASHLSKPFLLLAGISGTGKTRFVREQAKATGSLSDTYCLTSVRPDWHEPSDILGYISRLGGDGNAEYITTDVLQFIAKSWRAIIDAGLKLSVSDSNGLDTRLTVTGDKAQLDAVLPYWLCLDEMNLAPVEQYFADYLSVLETRVWQWDAEQFDYCCDPLLKSATIKQLADTNKLRSDLGFIDSKYDREWELFCEHGLSLPFNLIVAGTVNMDETTHGFSRKVIDRALSFDFGEFFPNDFDHFFKSEATHNTLSYPIYSHATVDDLPVIDSDGRKSIEFLKAVNQVLDNTPFQLAFRALNELLLAVISVQPTDEQQLKAVWDDFLMHKVLPRIEGDHDKLTIHNSTTNNDSLFDELSLVLARELTDIWHESKNSSNARPDLYREKLVAEEDDKVLRITCRSRAKLAWMKGRLERSGFTSFWP